VTTKQPIIKLQKALTGGRTDHYIARRTRQTNNWILLIYSFNFTSAFSYSLSSHL